MPRYFFHLIDSVEAFDEEGVELPDREAALLEATRSAREVLAAEVIGRGEIDLSGRIIVETGPGRQEFVLPFRDVLSVKP